MAEDDNIEEVESKGGGLKALLIPIISSAVTAAIVGAVLIFVLAPQPQQNVPQTNVKQANVSVDENSETDISSGRVTSTRKQTGIYHVYDSAFVVSIFDREKVHYLRVKVTLELKSNDIRAEIEAKDPQIRDSIIFVMSDFTLRELLDNQAKLLVKEVLLKTLDKIVGKNKVVNVYFTEFTVQ